MSMLCRKLRSTARLWPKTMAGLDGRSGCHPCPRPVAATCGEQYRFQTTHGSAADLHTATTKLKRTLSRDGIEIQRVINNATCVLKEAAVPEPEGSVEHLMAKAVGLRERADLLVAVSKTSHRVLQQQQLETFATFLQRRLCREPIQQIVGDWDFCGINLKMQNQILCPRPETEQLADWCIQYLEQQQQQQPHVEQQPQQLEQQQQQQPHVEQQQQQPQPPPHLGQQPPQPHVEHQQLEQQPQLGQQQPHLEQQQQPPPPPLHLGQQPPQPHLEQPHIEQQPQPHQPHNSGVGSTLTAVPMRVLDIGCGTGAIGLAILHALPRVVCDAIDIDAHCIALSLSNAQLNHVEDRYTCSTSSILHLAQHRQHTPSSSSPSSPPSSPPSPLYDLIVSNPPYIPETDRHTLAPEVALYESDTALFSGHDGLDVIKQIIDVAPSFLKTHTGKLVLEVDTSHPDKIEHLLSSNPLLHCESIMVDWFGKNRFVLIGWRRS